MGHELFVNDTECCTINKHLSNNYIQQHSQSLHQSINQCRTQQIAIKTGSRVKI